MFFKESFNFRYVTYFVIPFFINESQKIPIYLFIGVLGFFLDEHLPTMNHQVFIICFINTDDLRYGKSSK